MEIEIKKQVLGKEENRVEVSEKDYFEVFSKKWEIATKRLKPYLGKLMPEKQKKQRQNFKRTSHSFVYTGGTKKDDRDTEVFSNGKELS